MKFIDVLRAYDQHRTDEGKAETRDQIAKDVEKFLAKGGSIEQLKPRKKKYRQGQEFGSKHIGGSKEANKGTRGNSSIGRGRNIQSGKPVVNASKELSTDVIDTISIDVPLMLRMLEYAREDANTDLDLHDVTEKMIELSKGGPISMADYEEIVGSAGSEHEIDEAKGDIRKGLGALAIAAALYGGLQVTSAENTPLGKAMAAAAEQGDPVAAEHLDKLDFYSEENPVMIIKLSKKYLNK